MSNINKIRVNNVDYDINSENYSTTEQEIGTWTDGKTIYRKTIITNTNVNTDNWITEQFGTDFTVDTLVNIYGEITDTGTLTRVPCNFMFKKGNTQQIHTTWVSGNNLYHYGNTYLNMPLKVTIEYTKNIINN